MEEIQFTSVDWLYYINFLAIRVDYYEVREWNWKKRRLYIKLIYKVENCGKLISVDCVAFCSRMYCNFWIV